MATAEFPDLMAAVDALTVSSEYFRVNVRARVDDSQAELSSLLRRDPSSGRIELINRDLGRNFRSLFQADTEEGND
jgi:type II secretory pathway component PulK